MILFFDCSQLAPILLTAGMLYPGCCRCPGPQFWDLSFFILTFWVDSSLNCCSDLVLFGALKVLQRGMQVYAVVIH